MICNLGTRVVNNYLISSDTGLILIDTGYAGGFPHFMKMLKKYGIGEGLVSVICAAAALVVQFVL